MGEGTLGEQFTFHLKQGFLFIPHVFSNSNAATLWEPDVDRCPVEIVPEDNLHLRFPLKRRKEGSFQVSKHSHKLSLSQYLCDACRLLDSSSGSPKECA